MAKIYYSETDLEEMSDVQGVLNATAYTLRSPMPQVFLVTQDPELELGGGTVRTAMLSPISWRPYSKAISVPLADTTVARNLSRPGAQCVLALPSKGMLRQLTICAQWLPRGLSGMDISRFKMHKSLWVDVPSIEDCPVNFECSVDHVEEYHEHLVAFVRVVGASIDDAMIFRERDEIVAIYPTNFADEVVDENGAVRMRVSLLSDLYLCPTFPVAPKRGWYGTFDVWMKDLFDEEYLNRDEYEQVVGWHARWQEIFSDLDASGRAQLRENLTELTRLIARERWEELHAFLANHLAD